MDYWDLSDAVVMSLVQPLFAGKPESRKQAIDRREIVCQDHTELPYADRVECDALP
jgi:hypothetical protein